MTARAFPRFDDLNGQPDRPAESSSSPNTAELQSAELQARRALGLSDHPGGGSRGGYAAPPPRLDGQRRRFVRDGEVPVVVVARSDSGASSAAASLHAAPTNRLAIAETALTAERDARQRAERLLADATATIRELQTKLGHATLAREQAAATALRAAEQQQQLEHAVAAEQAARQRAETSLAAADAGRVQQRRPAREIVALARSDHGGTPEGKPARKVRVKGVLPRTPRRGAEPKPVRWW